MRRREFIPFIGGAWADARQLEVHGQQSDPVRRIGVPAEFSSAVDAVQRGVEVQEGVAEANQQMPSDRHIGFRIDVHFGDVMVGAGVLVGDDVNIAARLKSTAVAEGICISGAAYDHVGRVSPLTLIDLGMQSLTNVEPIHAYAVSVAAGPGMPKIAD
jgi:class 3 adenylate cyclase